MTYHIRSYQSGDEDICIKIFNSNCPKFVGENERPLFIEWLERKSYPYYVVERKNTVLACGGYAVENGIADLTWGLVHRDYHRQGIGSRLTRFRIDKIYEQYRNINIRIETSQHTELFYQKFGFIRMNYEKNGFAQGIDRIEMQLSPS